MLHACSCWVHCAVRRLCSLPPLVRVRTSRTPSRCSCACRSGTRAPCPSAGARPSWRSSAAGAPSAPESRAQGPRESQVSLCRISVGALWGVRQGSTCLSIRFSKGWSECCYRVPRYCINIPFRLGSHTPAQADFVRLRRRRVVRLHPLLRAHPDLRELVNLRWREGVRSIRVAPAVATDAGQSGCLRTAERCITAGVRSHEKVRARGEFRSG